MRVRGCFKVAARPARNGAARAETYAVWVAEQALMAIIVGVLHLVLIPVFIVLRCW